MADNKTKPTDGNVAAFVDAIADPVKRADTQALVTLMQRATGRKPQLWGPSIVGFGSYHYVYESGREGDMPIIGFSPRKAALVLYGLVGTGGNESLLARLGKHETGKGCLYIKRLADVDAAVLEKLVGNAFARKRGGGA